jgi:hypothetical protein
LTRIRPAAGAGIFIATLAAGLFNGTPAQAVAGGSPASDGSYRFVVKLDAGDRSCSGALIDPQWIITLRSCFPESDTAPGAPKKAATATIGRTNLSGTAGHVINVVHLVPHHDRNVVLAKLARAVIDVPGIRLGATTPVAAEPLRVAGYGRTKTEWAPDHLQTAAFSAQNVTETTLDLVDNAPTAASTCKGDAGGPAFRETSTGISLVALSSGSWQHGCYESIESRQGATAIRIDDLYAWSVENIRDPRWLVNANSDMCMGAGGSNRSGATVVQAKCIKNAADQQWLVARKVPDPSPWPQRRHVRVQIRNGHGLCLDVSGGSTARGAQVIQATCEDGRPSQRWSVDASPSQISEINGQPLSTGAKMGCIGVGGGSVTAGAKVIQWDCADVPDQAWIHGWPSIIRGIPGVASSGSRAANSAASSAGHAVAAEGGTQPSIEETHDYPFADNIFAARKIRLIKGDGNITLVECGSSANLIEVHSYKADDKFCFRVRGSEGYLTMELADVYGIKGDSHTVAAKVSIDDKEKSVDVPKGQWTGVGVGANENAATLLEIRATA